jgi:hypothetical protein
VPEPTGTGEIAKASTGTAVRIVRGCIVSSSEKVKRGGLLPAHWMMNCGHLRSMVTYSIVPVNGNGGLQVKSTVEPESMPTSNPSLAEIWIGMVSAVGLLRP